MMNNIALSIVGAARSYGPREELDFYPTPPHAIEALLKKEYFEGSIWECCCGDGAISKVLERHYHDVFNTDIVDRGYQHFHGKIDFLKDSPCLNVNNIITNPPFKYATAFVEQAKTYATDKIAMLLKTTFLEGQKRQKMFMDKDFPLKKVYQFSKRLTLWKAGEQRSKGGMISFAWFVWDKNHSGPPIIDWL